MRWCRANESRSGTDASAGYRCGGRGGGRVGRPRILSLASGAVQVIHGDSTPSSPHGPSVVTIGAYDGVHLGHRAVIGEVRRVAAERGLRTVVVTFDRHPASVVRPESAPKLLTDLEQKLELLATMGVDATYVVHFDEERAAESAEDFVDDLLVARLDARFVVVGEDFRFGHRRGGDVALLREMGLSRGFAVEGLDLVAPVDVDGRGAAEISSTMIRRMLAEGDVVGAAHQLGRPHEVRGTVERGDGRGGPDLGFPTANLRIDPAIQLPAEGVYAGWFRRSDGSIVGTAISLGHRPTFYARPTGEPLLECHLLDFSGDLYGESVAVRFVERLRSEERFESVDALIAKMTEDVERTRTILDL